MKRVMFVCKQNSARSQMAEGFARAIAADKLSVTSSGLQASRINPDAIQAMSEVGIDISDQTSKALSDFNPEDYDMVISLCGCGVNLPEKWLTREGFEDWELDDPAGQSMDTFRRVRDEIKQRVETLLQSAT